MVSARGGMISVMPPFFLQFYFSYGNEYKNAGCSNGIRNV